MDAMVEALKPIIIFAMVLWGIETVVTMLIKDHKQENESGHVRSGVWSIRTAAWQTTPSTQRSQGQCATTYFAAMISIASAVDEAARTA